MTCTGVVRGRHVELEGEVTLPEGMRVRVIPDEPPEADVPKAPMSLGEWLAQARRGRSRRPRTSDSTDLLRDIRDERASR